MRRIEHVGLAGGGLIGLSWASLFLARGLTVTIADPRPGLAGEASAFLEQAWPMLKELGLTQADAPGVPRCTDDPAALSGCDFVQENGPDRIDVKRGLIAQIEAAVAPDVVIASSTSSLLPSALQKDAVHPERILVAHPMNPPHLVPMVELASGPATGEAAMQTAEDFYRRLERVTIRLKQEAVGHLANRLTSALYREAVNIVAEGIASVEDVDKAITHGPGLRWALNGPHLTYHLGGGAGGYRHYLDHLGPTQEERWKRLGNPRLTEAVKDALVAGVEEELKGQDRQTLVQRRDAALVEVLKIKGRFGF